MSIEKFRSDLDSVLSDWANADINFAIFDKRVLLPLSQITQDIECHTSHKVSVEDLRRYGKKGWVRILCNDRVREGMPLYASSRIEMLLDLERQGWTAEELRQVAEINEAYIDDILLTEECQYIDDDLDALIVFNQEIIKQEKQYGQTTQNTRLHGRAKKARKALKSFRRLKTHGLTFEKQKSIHKKAQHLRGYLDFLRVTLYEHETRGIKSGYSPTIVMSRVTYPPDDTIQDVEINWRFSIESALAWGKDSTPVIRVPGFILKGASVMTTEGARSR